MILVTTVVHDEIFTFTPVGEEEEVHIYSGRLREWLHKHAKGKLIELTFPEEPLQSIVDRHGLEADRMASMTVLEAGDPVIVGLWPGGTHVLIDGGHRRWFWAKQGVNTLKGWAVPMSVWSMFIFNPAEQPNAVHHRDGSLLPQRRKHS